jgi:hypothetical protein
MVRTAAIASAVAHSLRLVFAATGAINRGFFGVTLPAL